MSKSPKIAIYSGIIPSTTFIERLIKGLAKRNHKILLFGIRETRIEYGGRVKVIDYGSNKIEKVLHYLKYLILLTLFKNNEKGILDRWLKENHKDIWTFKLKFYPVLYYKPDIFHIQWAKSLDDWIWVKKFGIKLVLSLRGAHINYSPIADKKLAVSYIMNFPKVDAFHAVSEAIKREASIFGANSDKTKIIYSGLNENFVTCPIVSPNNSRFQILSIGRGHWIKGYSYSLDAMYELKKYMQGYDYTIIGINTNIELLYQIDDLDLSNNVKLKSKKPFKDILKTIKKADILLLPSVEEGIANVVLEAMALGTIVLSTDCGGMSEVINNGKNGFLVPNRNPIAMAERLLEIYNMDESQLLLMRRNAKKTIQENHNEIHMIESMEELYNATLSVTQK